MIDFILGSAGSGKSTLITERIISDLSAGKRVILLVPEQMAVTAENGISSAAEKAGVCQSELEILNFKRLCNRVFREYGGIAYNSVNAGTKALLLWRALISSSPYLSYYKNSVEDAKHFVPKLVSALEELKQYCITPEMLLSASEKTKEDDGLLSDKLRDLYYICGAYREYLNSGFSDPSDDMTRLSEILSEHKFFEGVSVYLDSYIGFTPVELNVIRLMIKQADSFTVSLCLPCGKVPLAFENIEKTYGILRGYADRCGKEYRETRLTEPKRFNSPELAHLSEKLWDNSPDAVYPDDAPAIKTVVASDKYDETEYVAADICGKIENGARYRDFAVISRNNEDYTGIIDAVFDKYSLPCHISGKVPLSDMPVFKLVISALEIYNGSWQLSDVISFIKTGLTPVTPDKCDELEEYAHKWNICGSQWYSENDWFMNPDGFTDKLTEEGKALLESVNQTRRLIVSPLAKLFESLDGSRDIKTVCEAVYRFLTELGTDRIISLSGDNDAVRLWNSLCDALDTLVGTLPDIKASANLFAGLFGLVVSYSEVGTLPSTVDEIIYGAADRVRTENIKHVYLIGVNEGVFPAACRDDGLFSDREKILLEEYGLTMSPDSDSASASELFRFFRSACSASDSLTVSCCSADVGGEKPKPSIAYKRIGLLFPKATSIETKKLKKSFYIRNKKASLELSVGLRGTPDGDALEKIYREDDEYAGIFGTDIQPLITKTEVIDKETAEKLFGGDTALTQSRIDSYVLCAFGYHCSYVLGLKDSTRYSFNAADTGTFVHAILEKFFSSAIDEDGNFRELSNEETEAEIDRLVSDYLGRIYGKDGGIMLSPRAGMLFSRLRRNVAVVIAYMKEELKQGEFVPRFFELKITDGGIVSPLSIPLPNGSTVKIYGIADRVDICKKGEDVYVRVLDYKTGKKTFLLSDIEAGLNLQLLIYLFSIWKDENGSFRKALGIKGNIIPAGVLYCPASPRSVSAGVGEPQESINAAIEKNLLSSGLLIYDEEILRMTDKNLSGKYAPIKTDKSGFIVPSEKLKTLEELGQLLTAVQKTVSSIAMEMKSGCASAEPKSIGDRDSCKFCKSRSICRNPLAFRSDSNSY